MPNKHALIIGNSHYEDPALAKLVKPGRDARGLAEVLQTPEIGNFAVKLLIDEPQPVISRAITRFFAQRNRDDLLVLYFSGHGILDIEGQLYFAVRDTEHDALTATAIASNFVRQEMNRSYSRRQVLILDCCNSGSFSRSTKGVKASVGAVAQFEVSGYGRAVLTASDSLQYAWEDNDFVGQADYSVFTHFLIEGLRTGAADNEGDADGQTALDELFDYARVQMRGINAPQTPTFSVDKLTDPIIVARNPQPPAPKPTALPLELQQSIDDSRNWVREGAVAELSRLLSSQQPGLSVAAQEALQKLTSDDSRRVAEAATKILAAHRLKIELTEEELQARFEQFEKEDAERLKHKESQAHETEAQKQALPKAEDRRAVERAEEEGMVVHSPTPSASAAPQPALEALLTPAEDRRAIERAEGEGMLADIPTPVVEPKLPSSVAAWTDKPWFPLALLTVGWGAAMFIAQFTWWMLWFDGQDSAGLAYSLILGFLGGTATWLSLRTSTSTRPEISPVLMIGLWVVTTLLGLWLYPLLQDNGLGIDKSVALERAILGAVGGIGTSVILYRTGRMVNSQRAVSIGVGWTLAWLVSAGLGFSFFNLFGDDAASGIKEALTTLGLSDAWPLVPWVYSLIHGLQGALAGFISGRVMLRQLQKQNNP